MDGESRRNEGSRSATVTLERVSDDPARDTKRRKRQAAEDALAEHEHLVPVHPFHVQPSGNALLKSHDELHRYRRSLSLSMGLFSCLPDTLLLDILALLQPEDLTRLGATSSALLAFTSHEPLWKEALLVQTGRRLKSWQGTWKATLAGHVSPKFDRMSRSAYILNESPAVFSDELFLPLQLASVPLARYQPADDTNDYRRIQRVNMTDLTKQQFYDRFAKPSVPCLLTTEGEQRAEIPDWSIDDLKNLYPERRIRAEAISMSIDTYAAYAESCSDWERRRSGWVPDESPFYLFDPTLARTLQRDGRFVVPPLFRQHGDMGDRGTMDPGWDLFALLKDRRPDNAWIIAGPRRSGSGWHVDPNRTSAYNTVLSGRKLWMLLPPHIVPPGVFISEDAGTITAPLSIAEWLADFWKACVKLHGRLRGGDDTLQMDVCGPGETIYVPAGWKHLVVNLDESVAFTQNFVSPAELPAVLDFLKNSPDQISGFRMRRQEQTIGGDEDSDPEFDELPDGGVSEKEKLFDLFEERLRRFDESLCLESLEGMHRLEEERARSTGRKVVFTGRQKSDKLGDEDNKTHNWWQILKSASARDAASTSLAACLGDDDELGEVPW